MQGYGSALANHLAAAFKGLIIAILIIFVVISITLFFVARATQFKTYKEQVFVNYKGSWYKLSEDRYAFKREVELEEDRNGSERN